ncbi:MAG: peptide deformylase [Candidatus Cloacimonetes bacterium]|nr:peptide deformylase [Candidatus Cloacimonadota bacterium]
MKKLNPEQLPIRIIGDKVLRKVAEPIKTIDDELLDFLQDLAFTMYETDGVGLAAPQVGRSIRAFVVDPFWYREGHEKNPIFFINPKFHRFEGEEGGDEGCLSVPGIFEKVLRAEELTVEATNEKGVTFTMEAEGFLARVIQHENDHLDGILFIDKIPKLRRMIHAKRLRELKSTTNEQGINLGK